MVLKVYINLCRFGGVGGPSTFSSLNASSTSMTTHAGGANSNGQQQQQQQKDNKDSLTTTTNALVHRQPSPSPSSTVALAGSAVSSKRGNQNHSAKVGRRASAANNNDRLPVKDPEQDAEELLDELAAELN